MCRRKLYLCFSQYILGVQKIKRDRKKNTGKVRHRDHNTGNIRSYTDC